MRTMTRFAVIVTTMALYWVVAAAHAVAADPAALQRTGTGKDVPALAPLLLREDLTMSARLALQAIPGIEAGEALRAAVEKTSGLIKVGIIDSLGARREVAAVATLTQALLRRVFAVPRRSGPRRPSGDVLAATVIDGSA